jgi:hypothetical protein
MRDDNLFDDVAIPAAVEETQVVAARAGLAPVLETARAIVVSDAASYETACKLSQECAKRIKHVEAEFADAREKTHAAWKAVTTLIASLVDPMKKARELIDGKTVKWYREDKERKIIEEMRRVEEERKRLEEERLRNAVALEEAGRADIAEALFAEPVAAPVVEIEKPVVKCSAYRENWQFEVLDFPALVKAVAEKRTNIGFLMANESALRAQAKSLKAACSIPGVRVYDAGTMVNR